MENLRREAGMDRVQVDYTGMLGTVMNAFGDGDSLQQVGVDTRVQTAIAMQQVAEILYLRPCPSSLGKSVLLSLVQALALHTSQ